MPSSASPQKSEAKHERRAVMSDAGIIMVSDVVSRAALLLRLTVVANILTPFLFGFWQVYTIILDYSQYSNGGMSYTLSRELPYLRGKADSKGMQETKDVVFTATLISSIIVGIAVAIVSFVLTNTSLTFRIGLRLIAATIVLRQIYLYALEQTKAERQFVFFAQLNIGLNILLLLFGIVLTWFFGLIGFIASVLIVHALVVIFYLVKRHHSWTLHWNPARLWYLLQIGLQMISVFVLIITLSSIDKFMIAKFLDLGKLGLYGIAVSISGATLLLPSAIARAVLPRFTEAYGKHEELPRVRGYFEEPILLICFLVPFVSGLLTLLIPILIPFFFPKYTAGILTIQIWAMMTLVTAIPMFTSSIFVALRTFKVLIVSYAAAILLNGILAYGAIVYGYSIEGVALATGVVFLLLSAALMYDILKRCYGSWEALLRLLRCFIPLSYACVVIFGLSLILPPTLGGTFAMIILFIFLYSPVLWYGEMRWKVIGEVVTLLQRWLAYAKTSLK